jgi:hypothetical protein
MGEEDGVRNQDQQVDRSLWEMLQCPVRYTVLARSLAELEDPDRFLNLLTVGLLGFACRRHEVGHQPHVNQLYYCWDRRIGHRLKLSFQIVARSSEFSESERAIPLGVTRGRRSWNSHHPLGHPPQRLVFGIEGFECSTSLVVPPLIEPAGHRPQQSVDLGFQSGVPGDLQPPPQPVLPAISS